VPGQGLVDVRAFLDEDLDKGPYFRRLLPRQSPFATGQLDDDVSNPAGLTGLHHQILNRIVALVEQAERGHPVLDRRAIFAFHHLARSCGTGEGGGNLGRFLFGRAA